MVKRLMKMIYSKTQNYYFKNSTIKSHCISSNKSIQNKFYTLVQIVLLI